MPGTRHQVLVTSLWDHHAVPDIGQATCPLDSHVFPVMLSPRILHLLGWGGGTSMELSVTLGISEGDQLQKKVGIVFAQCQ